jgi:hypothetical protein
MMLGHLLPQQLRGGGDVVWTGGLTTICDNNILEQCSIITIKSRLIETAKFYFVDTGLISALLN